MGKFKNLAIDFNNSSNHMVTEIKRQIYKNPQLKEKFLHAYIRSERKYHTLEITEENAIHEIAQMIDKFGLEETIAFLFPRPKAYLSNK